MTRRLHSRSSLACACGREGRPFRRDILSRRSNAPVANARNVASLGGNYELGTLELNGILHCGERGLQWHS